PRKMPRKIIFDLPRDLLQYDKHEAVERNMTWQACGFYRLTREQRGFVETANGALALAAVSVNVPCASWQTDLWNRIKSRALPVEHFLARLWRAEPRFSQEDPMLSLEPLRQRHRLWPRILLCNWAAISRSIGSVLGRCASPAKGFGVGHLIGRTRSKF